MEIAGREFEGPYSESQLADSPGVYVVLDVNVDSSSYRCIDVGKSDTVATRIANHGRKQCWKDNTEGRRAFAVLYTGNNGDDYRRRIEQDVRDSTSPPCGDF